MSDIQFRGQLEFNGELIELLSSEFSANADQITFVPANNKTFYHIKSKLYPVTNTIITGAGNNGTTTANRRADIELIFDTVLKDVLTHDMETTFGQDLANKVAMGNAGQAGQYETNNHESMDGDAIKSIVLTSTNTSGTYRVQMEGYIKDTGTSP